MLRANRVDAVTEAGAKPHTIGSKPSSQGASSTSGSSRNSSARPSPRDTPVLSSPLSATGTSVPNDTPAPQTTGSIPHDIIRSHGQQFTSAELYEVLDFPSVYYWGQNIYINGKKKQNGLSDALPNHGYDDSKGDYLIQTHDHVAYRFEILEILGKGSFGQVVRAIDHKTKEPVALKIIRNKKRFTTQGEIEIRILEELKSWDPDDSANCVRMLETFKFRGHLCIVFELLSINLYEFIKGNDFRGFSIGLIRRFSVQILNCLCLLWKNEIIHCDLKPENVLLKSPNKSNIKVIDFGSSCHLTEKAYTYIQSRFYRSPEVILGATYDMAIDMWSLGCILVELYTGYPIFPGENEQDQLWCMMEVLGPPDSDIMAVSERKNMFFDANDQPIPFSNSKGKSRRINGKTLAQAVRCKDELFLDFIRKCLTWDPRKRMTPMEGIHHPWIVQIDTQTARGLSDVRSVSTNSTSRRSIANSNSNTVQSSLFTNNRGSGSGSAPSSAASTVSTLLSNGKPPRSLPPIAQLTPPQPSAAKPYAGARTSYASRALYASKAAVAAGTAGGGTPGSGRAGSGSGAGSGGAGRSGSGRSGNTGTNRWSNQQI